ncbi:tyrosine-type recombinase/integrase [Profundibacter sp.]
MSRNKEFKGATRVSDRHGKQRWRLRKTIKGRKIDKYIHGIYGSPQFRDEYEKAIAGATPQPKTAGEYGTFNYLITSYRGSRGFKSIKATTRYSKGKRLDRIRDRLGTYHYADLEKRHVLKLMDERPSTSANRLLKELGELFKYAQSALGFNGQSPTAHIEKIKIEGGGFHTWTVEEVEQYRDHHKSGTKARLAFELIFATGAARQDSAAMGWQNLTNGKFFYQRIKSGGRVECLQNELSPQFLEELKFVSRDNLTLITTKKGKPYTPEGFGNWFAKQCDNAGLPPECRAHGIRKHGAADLAERGASENLIAAWLGHKTTNEARTYTAAASASKMASAAMNLRNLSNPDDRLDKTNLQLIEKEV